MQSVGKCSESGPTHIYWLLHMHAYRMDGHVVFFVYFNLLACLAHCAHLFGVACVMVLLCIMSAPRLL